MADVQFVFAERAATPDAKQVDKGHGRLEVRTIRVSDALAGYSTLPGLVQVAEVRTRVTIVKTGEVRETVGYLVTSLTAEAADADRVLTLCREHWRIENTCFHVKDDSFGEDRHVLQCHQRGLHVSLLRGTAHNLLRTPCPLWADDAPMTARAEWVSARPLTVLARL